MAFPLVFRTTISRSMRTEFLIAARWLVTLLMIKVRSLSTTAWLLILPPGRGAGLEMTLGPLPDAPPMGVGVTSRGVTAAAGERFVPGLLALQAASPITTSVAPPRATRFPLLRPIATYLAQAASAWKLVTVAAPELTRMRRPQ